MSPSRTSPAILMKPNRASTMPRAATSTTPSWRAIHRAKTRAARRAIFIDRSDASRADREEFRLNGLPDLAGYELDQPYQRFGRRAGVVGVDGDRDQTRVLRYLPEDPSTATAAARQRQRRSRRAFDNRIISLGVWAPFPSAVNVAGVR